MGEFITSPFDNHLQVFRASIGSAIVGEGLTESIQASIKASIKASLKGTMKGVAASVKKLLKSDAGVEAVFRQLVKQGWKKGDEITEAMMKEAVKTVSTTMDDVVKGMTNNITKGLDDALSIEGRMATGAARSKIRKGIPKLAGEATETLATKFGLDNAAKTALKKSLTNSGYKLYSNHMMGTALKSMASWGVTFGFTGAVIGGGFALVYWGVATGVGAIADALADIGILPDGAPAAIADALASFTGVVVVIGLGFIGLITYKFVSALGIGSKTDDTDEEEAENYS